MSNDAWKDLLPTAEVSFMPEGDYDHSPPLLRVYPLSSGKRPFKIFNIGVKLHNS